MKEIAYAQRRRYGRLHRHRLGNHQRVDSQAPTTSAYEQTEYAPILRRFATYFVQEGRKGFPPEQIGATIHTALTTRSPRVRYAVVPQPFRNWIIPRLLPRRLVDAAL